MKSQNLSLYLWRQNPHDFSCEMNKIHRAHLLNSEPRRLLTRKYNSTMHLLLVVQQIARLL
jgi:hypothetical protein